MPHSVELQDREMRESEPEREREREREEEEEDDDRAGMKYDGIAA